MKRRYEFSLPWPPSVNRIWRSWHGHVALQKDARRFRELVVALVRGVEPLSGDLRLSVDFHPPNLRRRDLGNCEKALSDALQAGGVFKDDFQIKEMRLAMKEPRRPDGRSLVAIEEI